jgi:hypothetical protein
MNWYSAVTTVVTVVAIGGRPPAPWWWLAFAPLATILLQGALMLGREARSRWASFPFVPAAELRDRRVIGATFPATTRKATFSTQARSDGGIKTPARGRHR